VGGEKPTGKEDRGKKGGGNFLGGGGKREHKRTCSAFVLSKNRPREGNVIRKKGEERSGGEDFSGFRGGEKRGKNNKKLGEKNAYILNNGGGVLQRPEEKNSIGNQGGHLGQKERIMNLKKSEGTGRWGLFFFQKRPLFFRKNLEGALGEARIRGGGGGHELKKKKGGGEYGAAQKKKRIGPIFPAILGKKMGGIPKATSSGGRGKKLWRERGGGNGGERAAAGEIWCGGGASRHNWVAKSTQDKRRKETTPEVGALLSKRRT